MGCSVNILFLNTFLHIFSCVLAVSSHSKSYSFNRSKILNINMLRSFFNDLYPLGQRRTFRVHYYVMKNVGKPIQAGHLVEGSVKPQ
jgi:hypothetical protein